MKTENIFLRLFVSIVLQPMFMLLLATCSIYFIIGETAEAITMLAALLFVAGIDLFQNFRSQRAVKALSRITETKAKVIRSGQKTEIPTEEIVTEDIIICEEGDVIPADAEIISANDLAINEAILTGESVPVEKNTGDRIMQGTLTVRGYCYAKVQAIGEHTTLASIGQMVRSAGHTQTPLQRKVSGFVRAMVLFGGAAFVFVWIYHYRESGNLLHGLLHGLTMAMSVLPEEIPVALSTFMALGAYRLYTTGVIARSPETVETLGSATVICVDKTGTLTQNLMHVTHVLEFDTGEEIDFGKAGRASEVLEYAMWSSETSPFDPMEKSIHKKYAAFFHTDRRGEFRMIKEFPLAGSPPVMTHIFSDRQGNRIIACKGGLEGVLKLCDLDEEQKETAIAKGKEYAREGFRVLGVARGSWDKKELPEAQEEIHFHFLGLISFNDPPAPHIPEIIQEFYSAGMDVVMITGDYPETAASIARQTGINTDHIITGKEVAELDEEQLRRQASSTNVFARVSPQEKVRIIDALKKSGEVVAMTGDGVNDAPALKAAHIGIAMGKRGTEVARSAAGLVLSSDDLSKMVDAIYLGRRINENLRKAFRYIISIHIPIILLVTIPIFFTWLPPMLFTPVHVIFLELIMGPTCSIIYENEPIPETELKMPSNPKQHTLFSSRELVLTIIQGLAITAGCIGAGYYATTAGYEETKVRTYIFCTLVFSNILLTLVNRSFSQSIFKTITIRNRLVPLIIVISLLLLLCTIYIPVLSNVFQLEPLPLQEFLRPVIFAIPATLWMELYKYTEKKQERQNALH